MSTRGTGYTAERLAAAAERSTSLVDMLRRLDQPLGSEPLRYLRNRLAHYAIDTSHFVDESLPNVPRQRYSKLRLEEAAAASTSLREMIQYLDIAPYSSTRRYLTHRLRHFDIDTSHFRQHPGCRTAKIPANSLRTAAARSQSVAGVIRALSLPVNGATRTQINRELIAHCIPTEHFTGQGHYRNRASPRRRSADDILRRLPPGSRRARRDHLHRALQEREVRYVCDTCGTGDRWRGKHLVLEIDHINGDRLDNRLSNLRYLCPSCHSQTGTFAFKRSRHTPARPDTGEPVE